MSALPIPDKASWLSWWITGGLLLACCGTFLAFSTSVYSFFTFPKLMFLGFGSLMAWTGLAASRQDAAGRWSLAAPIAAFGAVLLLSTAVSRDPALSLTGDPRLCAYGGLQALMLVVLHYVATAGRPWVGVRVLFTGILIAAAASACYGLLQKTGVELVSGLSRGLPEGRITGLQGNPVYLGASLIMALPGALFLAESGRRWARWLSLAGGALVAVGVFFTYSRAAWSGALVACAAYGLLRAPTAFSLKRAAGALGSLLLIVLIGGAMVRASRPHISTSDSARVQLWLGVLNVSAKNPWLGSGPDTLEGALGSVKNAAFLRAHGLGHMQNHAHNDLLQALATMGILGLGAYLWLQWALFRAAREALTSMDRRETAAYAAALLGLFVQMKVNPASMTSLTVAAVFSGLMLPKAAPLRSRSATLLCLPVAAAAVLSVFLYLADAAYLRGFKAYRAGRQEEALHEFRQAVRFNPVNTRYWIGATDALFAHARREPDPERRRRFLVESVDSARMAVAWRPGAVETHNLLGVSLLRLGQDGSLQSLAEADAVLTRAMSMDTGSVVLRENALILARIQKRPEREAELAAELSKIRTFVTK